MQCANKFQITGYVLQLNHVFYELLMLRLA